MPTGYQCFKNEIFKSVKDLHFSDYKLKEGDNLVSLVSKKCKEEWGELSEVQKLLYNTKAKELTNEKEKKPDESPPPYEEKTKNNNGEVNLKEIPKLNKESIKKECDQTKTEVTKPLEPTQNSKKRKSIPKAVKESIWKKYISETELKGKCFVGCGKNIQINDFEVGHVIAVSNGGKNTIENLRPICSLCNKSMGSTNLYSFIEQFGFKEKEPNDIEEVKNNNKKITSIEKLIKKQTTSLDNLTLEQEVINSEIKSLEEIIADKKILLESKIQKFSQNEKQISKIESNISKKNDEKNSLEKLNNNIKEKRDLFIRNKMIEEDKLKEEIRKELILEQKKKDLKKQVMEEMGLN